jgi:hypothetical protein
MCVHTQTFMSFYSDSCTQPAMSSSIFTVGTCFKWKKCCNSNPFYPSCVFNPSMYPQTVMSYDLDSCIEPAMSSSTNISESLHTSGPHGFSTSSLLDR